MGKLTGNLKSDTLLIWTSFFEYVFFRKDPRRVQVLVDQVLSEFKSLDFNSELSFDVIKTLSLFRAWYEGMGWKAAPWVDECLDRYWAELHSEHDDVRAYIGEFLSFSDKVKVRCSFSFR